MNKLKKYVILLTAFLMISGIFYSPESVMASNIPSISSIPGDGDIVIQSADKEWHYKIMNGGLYKRLFNKETKKWETDWIFVRKL